MNFALLLLMLALGTWLSATGMLFLKFASGKLRLQVWRMLFDGHFLLAAVLYASSFLIYINVLRELPISIAYPLTSMNYIWAALLSKRFLNENVDVWRWGGICLIIIGIALLSFR